jgi:hypothetical protein
MNTFVADDTASAEKLAKLLDNRRIFQKEITGKIRSEQFSEEERHKNSWTLPSKSLSSIEATFAMLNVPKTVRFRFIIRVAAVWRVLLVTKRTL